MTDDVQLRSNEAPATRPPLADGTPEQAAELRYLKAIEALVDDAVEGKQMEVLADTLAWTIARISVTCGIAATADILRRIGGYMGTLVARREAEAEARQAKEEGRHTH